jgi:hypothetical protein
MLTVYHVLLAVLFHTVKQECSKDAQRITRSVGECEAQKSIIERDLPKGKQDNALPNTDGRNRDIIIQIHNLEIKYTSSISKSRCFVAQMQETDLRSRRLLNRVGKRSYLHMVESRKVASLRLHTMKRLSIVVKS